MAKTTLLLELLIGVCRSDRVSALALNDLLIDLGHGDLCVPVFDDDAIALETAPIMAENAVYCLTQRGVSLGGIPWRCGNKKMVDLVNAWLWRWQDRYTPGWWVGNGHERSRAFFCGTTHDNVCIRWCRSYWCPPCDEVEKLQATLPILVRRTSSQPSYFSSYIAFEAATWGQRAYLWSKTFSLEPPCRPSTTTTPAPATSAVTG